MKRILCLILAMTALWGCAARAEQQLTDVRCAEEQFSTKAPTGAAAVYAENTGFQIFVEKAGLVPYVIVSRRPLDMKFSDPVNFLNNVFREHMENQYGENMIGMNPCKKWEIGGKTLLGARYLYKVKGTTLCLLRLIEVRDDGDVEYSAKTIEGQDGPTMEALDAAVRYYQPDGGKSAAGQAVLAPAAPGSADTMNGTYRVRIADADRIVDGGFFTAKLYAEDTYPAAQVEALKPGDAVQVNGEVLTAASIERYEEGLYELIPEGGFDGYIVFRKGSGGSYTAEVNDWTPCQHLTDVKVMLPLPYQFAFGWVDGSDEATVYDADAFINLLSDGETADQLTQYNTMIQFQDGLTMMILHTDYPEGPEGE